MGKEEKRVLSLFSGCGGMDIGFEGGFTCGAGSVNADMHPDWIEETLEGGGKVLLKKTSFETVFANDIKPDARRAWTEYFSAKTGNADEIYHLDSIVDLVKRAKAGEKVFPDGIDVVTGGFPCQDFSVSGKRLGLDSQKSHTGKKLSVNEPTAENRGHLYMWMKEVVALTKPKVFVAENVKGLTNLGDVKEVIEHDFASAGGGGYLVVPAKVLYAPDYGVPQMRERVIFFGFRKSALSEGAAKALRMDEIPAEYDPYPPHTHGTAGYPYVTCREALAGLPEPEEAEDPAQQKYSKAGYMGAHCQGQSEIRLGSVAPTIRSEHHGNIEYRRLSREHGGKHEGELASGLKERRLTVRECARLQTFPDEYRFILPPKGGEKGVSASSAYKLIGNAVPCVMAHCIARNLEEKWDIYFKHTT